MKYVLTGQDNEKLIFPGLVVAGLRGGSGKTIFSLGIISLLKSLKISVAPFKKGPDYIDAGWLAMAAGQPCYNLDAFLTGPESVFLSYQKHSKGLDFSIIEGNRGLYDCTNLTEDTSTAGLAKLLKLPVILCADVSKVTKTMAAIIYGIIKFDSNVKVVGVILNRVAGIRHQRIITRSIEKYCGIKVLGAIPKLTQKPFPERHMGLVPTPEYKWAKDSINFISSIAKKYINISEIIKIINGDDAKFIQKASISYYKEKSTISDYRHFKGQLGYYSCLGLKNKEDIDKPIIGIMLDSAFQFYYPENLEALKKEGAELIFISPLKDKKLPQIDALYIGGGFPETHAIELENNFYMREEIKMLADSFLPIYAECGGLIYLGESLIIGKDKFTMSGVLPAVFKIWKKPQGHGYSIIRVINKNPYYPLNSKIIGHEFHYSSVYNWKGNKNKFAFLIKKGSGFIDNLDGVFYKNVMATYIHIHASGTKIWAKSLVNKAIEFKSKKRALK